MSKRPIMIAIGAAALVLLIGGGLLWWNQSDDPGGDDTDALVDGGDKLAKLESPCTFIDDKQVSKLQLREVGESKDIGGQKNCAWKPDDEDAVHTIGIAVSRADPPGPAGWDKASLNGISDPVQRASGQERCDIAWPTSYGHAKIVGIASGDAEITCAELIETTEPLLSDIPE